MVTLGGFKYGIGNNDISIINKSLDTLSVVVFVLLKWQLLAKMKSFMSERQLFLRSYSMDTETEGKQIAYSTAPGSNSSMWMAHGRTGLIFNTQQTILAFNKLGLFYCRKIRGRQSMKRWRFN